MWDGGRNEDAVFETNGRWAGRHSSEMQPPPGVAKSDIMVDSREYKWAGSRSVEAIGATKAYCSTSAIDWVDLTCAETISHVHSQRRHRRIRCRSGGRSVERARIWGETVSLAALDDDTASKFMPPAGSGSSCWVMLLGPRGKHG